MTLGEVEILQTIGHLKVMSMTFDSTKNQNFESSCPDYIVSKYVLHIIHGTYQKYSLK